MTDALSINTRRWFVYFVRALNSSLYCGISNDPVVRFYKHCRGKGAKFFLTSPAKALVYIEQCDSKGEALRREMQLKKLPKEHKEYLVAIGCRDYKLPLCYDDKQLLTLSDIIN